MNFMEAMNELKKGNKVRYKGHLSYYHLDNGIYIKNNTDEEMTISNINYFISNDWELYEETPKTLAEEINEWWTDDSVLINKTKLFEILRNHNKRIKAIFEDVGNTFDWTIEGRNALNEEISKISGEL